MTITASERTIQKIEVLCYGTFICSYCKQVIWADTSTAIGKLFTIVFYGEGLHKLDGRFNDDVSKTRFNKECFFSLDFCNECFPMFLMDKFPKMRKYLNIAKIEEMKMKKVAKIV